MIQTYLKAPLKMIVTCRSDILNTQYLSECFDADYEGGLIKWKSRPLKHFTSERGWKIWNTRYSGKVAGSFIKKGKSGYYRTTINNMYFYNHQILWVMFYGWELEGFEIDHIDRNTRNNSIRNLRLATRTQQVWNTSSSNNLEKGVSFDNSRQLWLMQFEVAGKRISARFSNQHTASLLYDVFSYHYHNVYYYGGNSSIGEVLFSEITPKVRKELESLGSSVKTKFSEFYEGLEKSRIKARRGAYIRGVSFIKPKKIFSAYKTKDFGEIVGEKSLGNYDNLLDACCARISWENSMKGQV